MLRLYSSCAAPPRWSLISNTSSTEESCNIPPVSHFQKTLFSLASSLLPERTMKETLVQAGSFYPLTEDGPANHDGLCSIHVHNTLSGEDSNPNLVLVRGRFMRRGQIISPAWNRSPSRWAGSLALIGTTALSNCFCVYIYLNICLLCCKAWHGLSLAKQDNYQLWLLFIYFSFLSPLPPMACSFYKCCRSTIFTSNGDD